MKRNLSGYILCLLLVAFAFHVLGCAKKIITEPTEAQDEVIYQKIKKDFEDAWHREVNKTVEKPQEVKTSKPQEVKTPEPQADLLPKVYKINTPTEDIAVIDEGKAFNKFTYLGKEKRYLCTQYVVGTWAENKDCLWNIAKKPEIYNNAWRWVDIFQANKDQIKDPDLIYPGQVLQIKR